MIFIYDNHPVDIHNYVSKREKRKKRKRVLFKLKGENRKKLKAEDLLLLHLKKRRKKENKLKRENKKNLIK